MARFLLLGLVAGGPPACCAVRRERHLAPVAPLFAEAALFCALVRRRSRLHALVQFVVAGSLLFVGAARLTLRLDLIPRQVQLRLVNQAGARLLVFPCLHQRG